MGAENSPIVAAHVDAWRMPPDGRPPIDLTDTTPAHVVMEACGTSHYWDAPLRPSDTVSRFCLRSTCGPLSGGRRQIAPTRRPARCRAQ